MADEIRKLASSSAESTEEITKIENVSKGICDISINSLDGSTEISAVVEEQLATQEEFFSSALVLTNMASDLKGIVSEFEV